MFSIPRRKSSLGLSAYPLTEEEPGTSEPGAGGPLRRALRRIISIEEDPLPQLLDVTTEQPLNKCSEEEGVPSQGAEGPIPQAPPLTLSPKSPRGQPVGKEALCRVRDQPYLVCRHCSIICPLLFHPGVPEGIQEVDTTGSGMSHIPVFQRPPCPAWLSVSGRDLGY